jgi:hypothetical protein
MQTPQTKNQQNAEKQIAAERVLIAQTERENDPFERVVQGRRERETYEYILRKF